MGSSTRPTRQEPSSAPQSDSTKTHRSAPRRWETAGISSGTAPKLGPTKRLAAVIYRCANAIRIRRA
jgi:hypothetical protein